MGRVLQRIEAMLPLRPESPQAHFIESTSKGQPTTLTEERIKRLISICFKWYTSFMRAQRCQ